MNPLVERLGWTLLHSLWQGVLAYAVLRIALSLLRRSSPQARYLAACGALVLATVAPWITFFQLDVTERLSRFAPPGALHAPASLSTANTGVQSASHVFSVAAPESSSPSAEHDSLFARFGAILRPAFPWFVGLWLIGFAVSCLRLLHGWRRTRALTLGVLTPPTKELAARFASLLSRLGLRGNIRLALSPWVHGPAVVGWLRPVVLLPVEVLAGLTPGQIDALLIHELAHIRRADFLVNLLQAVTEALFFYHPAVRAINRLIRDEREHACDDLAVALCGDPVNYARALAALASRETPGLALAATGSDEPGGLLGRIRRLLGRDPARPRPFVTLAWAAMTGAVLYLAAMLGLPALTARLLTPEERIALVKQTADAVAAQATPEFPEDARMTVVGEVRTDDGSPLPANLRITGLTQNRRRSMSADVRVVDGQVRQSMNAGEFYLLLFAPGWAPTFAGPFQPKRAGEELVLPPMVLRRGFPVKLRVTDDHGRPLPGVRLRQPWIRQAAPAGNRNLNRPWSELATDAEGEAVFANVGPDTELEVTVEQPGFQKTIRAFKDLHPDATLVLPLVPARPLPGEVSDAETGRPIPGAQILLAGHQRPETNMGYSLQNNMRLAVADEGGRFVLDTLNERWTTYVYVTAPGYAPASVEAGPSPLRVPLDRGIRVAGRVRAAAGQLSKPTLVTAEYSLRTGPQSSYGHRLEQSLDLKSPEPAFAFENLPRGTDSISLTVAGRSVSLPGDKDHLDVLMDLTATASQTSGVMALGELPQRKVVITLRPPAGEPTPEGEVEVDYQKHGLHRSDGSLWPLPRLTSSQGRVELLLPVPNRLKITQARLPGYASADRTYDIPDGPSPLALDLDVVPAGAIRGRLLDANGTGVSNWFLNCRSAEPAESRHSVNLNTPFWGEQKTNAAGGFLAGGLPFGHRYIIVTHRDFFYAASDAILLTRRDPLRELEWRLPPAASHRGRLVGPDGLPVPLASLELFFHAGPDHLFGSGTRIVTEPDGRFEIPGLNSAQLDRYELQLVGRKNWQPFIASLPRNPSSEEQTFMLTRGHRLSGRMLDAATGLPLADILVRAHRVHEESKNATPQQLLPVLAEDKTDAEGRFQFSTFPAGKFRLASDQGNVDSPVITLPDADGATLDVRLKPWAKPGR